MSRKFELTEKRLSEAVESVKHSAELQFWLDSIDTREEELTILGEALFTELAGVAKVWKSEENLRTVFRVADEKSSFVVEPSELS